MWAGVLYGPDEDATGGGEFYGGDRGGDVTGGVLHGRFVLLEGENIDGGAVAEAVEVELREGSFGAAGAGTDDEVGDGGVDKGAEFEEAGGVAGLEAPPGIEMGGLAPTGFGRGENEGMGAGLGIDIAEDGVIRGAGSEARAGEGDLGYALGAGLFDEGFGGCDGEE